MSRDRPGRSFPSIRSGISPRAQSELPPEFEPNDPLVHLLERYAERRLSPRSDELTRLRAGLVQAYVVHGLSRERPPTRWLTWPRRLALAGAVIVALAGSASLAAAESGPGQPFYHLKLTVETLTLPAQGSARITALLAHLDTRLTEAHGASARGDRSAVADAIAAYEDTLSSLSDAVVANGGDAFVLAELDRHVAILEDLLTQVPAQARAGLQRALDHAQRARDAINQRQGPPDRPTPGSQRSPGAGASNRP